MTFPLRRHTRALRASSRPGALHERAPRRPVQGGGQARQPQGAVRRPRHASATATTRSTRGRATRSSTTRCAARSSTGSRASTSSAGRSTRPASTTSSTVAGPDPALGRFHPETVVRVFTPGVVVALHGDPDLKLVSHDRRRDDLVGAAARRDDPCRARATAPRQLLPRLARLRRPPSCGSPPATAASCRRAGPTG